jgi:hypothetical protein
MRSKSIFHAGSQQFVLCSSVLPSKLRTLPYISISKQHKNAGLFNQVAWITKTAVDPMDMSVGLKCTGLFISLNNDNFTWYLMVVNTWPMGWLDRNICLPDCLEAGENLRVNYHTHCWMYPLILLTKMCYHLSCSCCIFLFDVTLVTSFFMQIWFRCIFFNPLQYHRE